MSVLDVLQLALHPEVASVTVTGYVATSTLTSTPVRATAYAPPGANGQRSLASSNAADTLAGTGARQVKITYLSTDMGALKTDTINLSGTTPVNTNQLDIALIEKIEVISTGTGNGNAGTITLFGGLAGTGGTVATIAVGDNRTFWCHHYVAVGKTFYPLVLTAGATAASGQVSLFAILNFTSSPNGPQVQVGSTYLHGNQTSGGLPPVNHSFGAPNPVAGPAIVFLSEKAAAVTASTTHASFEYLEF